MSKAVTFKALLCLVAMGTFVYFLLPMGLRGQRNKAIKLKTRDYLVSSPKCHIPDINPFHRSILPLWYPVDSPIQCENNGPPITFTEQHEGRVRLRKLKPVSCCYFVIERFNDTHNKPLDNCVPFEDAVILAPHVQHVHVRCVNGYKNVHPMVQPRVEGVLDNSLTSVVIIGIDSMSRLSLIRNMQHTVNLLRELKWVELKGYNKVGANTLPNLMALLAGLNESQAQDIGCMPPSEGIEGMDHCPNIWNDFKRRGYTTAYAEDADDLSTFNYETPGFLHQPTDFYIRPSIIEAYRRLSLLRVGNFAVCLGETRTTDVILRYTQDLLNAFPAGLFSLIWMNNFSHDDENVPGTADSLLFDFFQGLPNLPAYQSTVFVFLSDHGIRFGPIRQTNVGWFEERLPFAYLWIPPKFRELHPKAFDNLVANGARLTSPFDLHLTLMDVLGRHDAVAKGCPKCTSLFEPVDPNRSCSDAGITPNWCTCLTDIKIPTSSPQARKAAQAIMFHVNALLKNANEKSKRDIEEKKIINEVDSQCALLSLGKITRVREVDNAEVVVDIFVDYRVSVSVLPGGAVLEATVRHWKEAGTFNVLGDVSRVDAMVKGVACKWVGDKVTRMFCHCVEG